MFASCAHGGRNKCNAVDRDRYGPNDLKELISDREADDHDHESDP
jgi:hypothetical protein